MKDLKGYKLLHEGSISLSQVEHNGIRVDLNHLEKADEELGKKILESERNLQKDPIFRKWIKRFGQKTNLYSKEQLGIIFFDVLKYPCKNLTGTGKYKADESTFLDIDLPFVKEYFKLAKIDKVKNTFLRGIKKEVTNSYLHPSFNLHKVETFRSSSDSPNFQNLPIRNKVSGAYIRKCFIPRKGRCLVEIDYSGIEVKIAACYHKDPVMIKYLTDPTSDMHRDTACDCYILKPEQVSKDIRYCAKNMFVFPAFYGSFYVDCARNLWEAIDKMKLTLTDGKLLKDHLQENGITELGLCDEKSKPISGTFEYHIKQVEQKFWQDRFTVYAEWKERNWKQYLKEGYLPTHTGFKVQGIHKRNEVLNYAIQGSAFHCLLWSLIHIQKWLNRNKFKTLIVGQIHDCLLLDVPYSELQEVLYKCHEIMTQWLRKTWKWIIVPMETEVDVVEEGQSWHDKATWIMDNGEWQAKIKK